MVSRYKMKLIECIYKNNGDIYTTVSLYNKEINIFYHVSYANSP